MPLSNRTLLEVEPQYCLRYSAHFLLLDNYAARSLLANGLFVMRSASSCLKRMGAPDHYVDTRGSGTIMEVVEGDVDAGVTERYTTDKQSVVVR